MDGLFLDGKSIRLTNQRDARAEVPQDCRHLYVITIFKKLTAEGDCSHESKRNSLFGRKAVTNLDIIFNSRDITLPTKVHLVKAMVFPVVMDGYGKDYEES